MKKARKNNEEIKKPNLFIVGQPRCGTSSLYLMLKQHPEIFMSEEKEPHYFCKDLKQKIKSKKEYLDLFKKAKNEKIIGEVTPSYLRSKVAAEEIKKFNPNAKIIMILREPVDFLRAMYQKAASTENENFKKIDRNIWKEEYLNRIKYSKQVKRYLDNFPKKNIKIIIYKDYKNNNEKTLKEIFEFLGVDSGFKPEKEKINPSRFNRFGKLNILLKRISSKKPTKKIKKSIPKKIRKPLQKGYRKAIYKDGRMEIPEKTKKELSKKIKPEVEKTDKLLHEKGFLPKERSLVYEWGYKKV